MTPLGFRHLLFLAKTKPKYMASSKEKNQNSVIFRTVVISAIILAGLFTVAYFLEDNIAKIFKQYSDEVSIGIMLFSLWLVVSSTVRSINRLEKRVASWKLLVAGVATAAFGSGLFVTFLYLFPKVSKSTNTFEVGGASGELAMVMSGLAFIISLLTIVNTRVGSKMLANILEFVIIGGVIAGLIWFISR